MSTVQKEQFKKSLTALEKEGLVIDAHTLSLDFSSKKPEIFTQWNQLVSSDPASTILENPDYILKEMQEAGPVGKLIPQLILARTGNQLRAAAVLIPKQITAGHLRGWKSRKIIDGFRLAGNRITGDQSSEIQNALDQEIKEQVRQSHAEFLLIDDLACDSVLDGIVNETCHAAWKMISPTGKQDHHWIEFPESAEDYWGTFKSKTRNTLKRKLKKMGDIEFIPVTDPSQIPDFLNEAHEISKNTWQSKELGLRIENSKEELDFYRFLAEKKWLRAFLLKKESQPVAFVIGTQFNNSYYLDELGFDREFSRLSPGTVLFHLLVNELLENSTPAVLDFGLGDAEYKQLFGNKTTQSRLVYLLPHGGKSTLSFYGFHTWVAMKSTVKKAFSRIGVWKELRRKIKDRVVRKTEK